MPSPRAGLSSLPSFVSCPGPMAIPEAALAYPEPRRRSLQIYAVDPMIARLAGNEVVTITVPYEPLQAGPSGELVQVIDYDAANEVFYTPVDLDDPILLAQDGLTPSERDPRFHQQMVYAVISSLLENFERGLGRRFRWRGSEAAPDPSACFPGRECGLRRRARRTRCASATSAPIRAIPAATCRDSGCSAACPTTSSSTRRPTPWWIGCAPCTRRPRTSTCTPSTKVSPTRWPCSSTSRCPICWPATSSPTAATSRRGHRWSSWPSSSARAAGAAERSATPWGTRRTRPGWPRLWSRTPAGPSSSPRSSMPTSRPTRRPSPT